MGISTATCHHARWHKREIATDWQAADKGVPLRPDPEHRWFARRITSRQPDQWLVIIVVFGSYNVIRYTGTRPNHGSEFFSSLPEVIAQLLHTKAARSMAGPVVSQGQSDPLPGR